jgi:hypothetical protein
VKPLGLLAKKNSLGQGFVILEMYHLYHSCYALLVYYLILPCPHGTTLQSSKNLTNFASTREIQDKDDK